jgi:hypothetical protein
MLKEGQKTLPFQTLILIVTGISILVFLGQNQLIIHLTKLIIMLTKL